MDTPARTIAPEVTPPLRHQQMRHRTLIKLAAIAVLSGLLLIPLALLEPVVGARVAERDRAVQGIQRDWGGTQALIGPVLVLPLASGSEAYALPDELKASGDLAPEV